MLCEHSLNAERSAAAAELGRGRRRRRAAAAGNVWPRMTRRELSPHLQCRLQALAQGGQRSRPRLRAGPEPGGGAVSRRGCGTGGRWRRWRRIARAAGRVRPCRAPRPQAELGAAWLPSSSCEAGADPSDRTSASRSWRSARSRRSRRARCSAARSRHHERMAFPAKPASPTPATTASLEKTVILVSIRPARAREGGQGASRGGCSKRPSLSHAVAPGQTRRCRPTVWCVQTRAIMVSWCARLPVRRMTGSTGWGLSPGGLPATTQPGRGTSP